MICMLIAGHMWLTLPEGHAIRADLISTLEADSRGFTDGTVIRYFGAGVGAYLFVPGVTVQEVLDQLEACDDGHE